MSTDVTTPRSQTWERAFAAASPPRNSGPPRCNLSNAGLSAQIVVLSPKGIELERFPEPPGTGDNGSEIPFDTPSSATFLGRRLLVANQSYLGTGQNHAVLDVMVGERGEPVFIPRTAGRRR